MRARSLTSHDYKFALQGDSLDSRTNPSKEGEVMGTSKGSKLLLLLLF